MTDDKKFSGNKAFLPIGITFMAVAVVFLATQMSAGLWISFFTIGITFLVLSMQKANPEPEDKAPDTDA